MAMTGFKVLEDLKAQYDAAVEKEGKKNIDDMFKEFFEKHPEVQAVQWEQYAPYFNDGDACVFHVHEPSVRFFPAPPAEGAEPLAEGEEPPAEDSEDFVDHWDLDAEKYPALAEDLQAIHGLMSRFEDLFNTSFGDDIKVTATRKGYDTDETRHD